jgi:DNA-binding LacI/PurR family transcriptional regulator
MKRITIKDVAKEAGVSAAAVSYVLNGKKGKISPVTLEKVNQAISSLNYIPDFSARSLANNKSKLIGVVIPQTEESSQLLLENPFYSEIISGIEYELRKKGYHFILSGVNKGNGYLDISMQRNLDGAIIMGIYQEQFYDDLKKVNIPIILIDSYINDNSFLRIGIDDELGGAMATKHLIESGHTNIALVTGVIKKDGVVEKRFLGYKSAFKEANLFYNPDFVFEDSVSYEFGVQAGQMIAQKHPEITAVFATADLMAYGVITGLVEAGKRVPDDVSVIGFDDISISRIFMPKLTTVKQNITEKGIQAAESLIHAIEGMTSSEPKEIILPLELVERQTVKRITG